MEDLFTASNIIAFFTLLTSVIAIFYTAKSLQIERKHNYQSVKPIASIDLGDYENDIYVRISNNGIGPMIIKDVLITNGSLTCENLIEIIPESLRHGITWYTFTAKIKNQSIKVDSYLYLLQKKFKNEPSDNDEINQRQIIREELCKISIKIIYTDIYEKNYYEVERKLDWFARNLEKKKTISRIE